MNRAASMPSANSYSIVLVTAPDVKTARMLAKAALNKRLVACANLIPKLESHYWWRGKVENGSEVLMILKTSNSKLGALEKLIIAEHPYDTPEFIALTINRGNKRYLNWLANSVV
jgi:periplasmic divalent cation tolerance protein